MRIERQNAILRLINEHDIETQSELTDSLRALGYEVTQATVSRDIKDLRLVKKQSENGKSVYSKNSDNGFSDIDNRFNLIFSKCVVAIEYAVNNIVIKTLPGMAQAAGAAVDAMDFPEVVGTIAGDDTVMMVVRSEESARRLVYKLRAMTDM
jgi:transcriptional regulator of arginine metabolism